MVVAEPTKNIISPNKSSLFADYSWYYSNFYLVMVNAIEEFFAKKFDVRFMGIAGEDNILFYGDEYFVNKIAVNKSADFKVKLSSDVISSFLDTSIGLSEKRFELEGLTDIEAMLIKSFTVFLYKKLENNFEKSEVSRKVVQNSQEYNFNFFIKNDGNYIGKIIITIPDYLIKNVTPSKLSPIFTIEDFSYSPVNVKLAVGKSKIALNEIKVLEDGDIILLEDSDINKMSVLWEENKMEFMINPNPSLIISVDNSGDDEMEEETSVKSQNMWDSILVDIVAEFDNVKLTLGDLKQISEGLVIDVGSVYDNKIKLRVENQVVATGELVILNDRYGVRIDSVKKSKETSKKIQEPSKQAAAQKQPAPKANAEASAKNAKVDNDENFDYSDFEIEDESI